MTNLSLETLQERIAQSELGEAWSQNTLLQNDIWSLTDLGCTPEQLSNISTRKLYFKQFQLHWLKFLAKLTVLAQIDEKRDPDSVRKCVSILHHLDTFLLDQGYSQASELSNHLLQEFIAQGTDSVRQTRQRFISYATKLWAEEDWLKINLELTRYKPLERKVEVIPEEVLNQIYNNFDLLPLMLERLFRLQLALGLRISEILMLPRHCLKHEGEQWFIKRWVGKRKVWKFFPIHSLVAEVIQEQQRFLNEQFGVDSEFDRLFCWMSSAARHGAKQPRANATRFEIEPIYRPKLFNTQCIGFWLRDFSKIANLKDKYGNPFGMTSHMFRRTKASIMAYCNTEDEYIAAILGHASLDMLPPFLIVLGNA